MVTEEKKKEYKRNWYLKNREDQIEQAKQREKAKRKRNYEYIQSVKESSKCARCGFDHPGALIFHHKNGSDKVVNVSQMRSQGLKTIQEEIAKCEIICANCHSIEHWEERRQQELNGEIRTGVV